MMLASPRRRPPHSQCQRRGACVDLTREVCAEPGRRRRRRRRPAVVAKPLTDSSSVALSRPALRARRHSSQQVSKQKTDDTETRATDAGPAAARRSGVRAERGTGSG